MHLDQGRADAIPPGPWAHLDHQDTPSASSGQPSLPGVDAAASVSPSPRRLPTNISKPELPVTGWERIRELFDREATQSIPEEIHNFVTCGVLGGLVGFVYGGLPAARHARQRHIQGSQAQLYSSRLDAVRSAHNAAIRGFVRYGWRWSWRVAVIVSMFNAVSSGLCVYRDKDAVSHYIAAGAVTAGLFRLNLGIRGLVSGSLIGAVLGVPVGAAVLGLQSLSGETVRERRRRERRELHEHKVAEWMARLQLTDDLISELNVSSQPEEASRDLQRIQELLTLPPNESNEP